MDENKIRSLKLIYIAQAAGATFFAGVVAFLTFQAIQRDVLPTGSQLHTIKLLSCVLFVFACLDYFVSNIIFKKVLRGQGPTDTNPLPSRINSAFIFRIAMFQGLSFFGLVVFMLDGIFGVFHSHPAYILTSAPYFFLLALIMRTFPTNEMFERLINEINGGLYS